MSEVWITLRSPNRRALTVLVDSPLVVGRECDGLIVNDHRVSRRHTSFQPIDHAARAQAGDHLLQVTDLDSSNGTMLNGTRIEGPAFVGPNDQITIGETVISVRAASSSRRVDTMTTELVTPSPKNQKTSIDLVADAMVGDKTTPPVIADVIGVESQPGTLTVLFSDIESSTELALAMGDALWFNLLRQHHNLVAAHVRAHHGRIVKNQGDGYMLCFRSARQALLTAIGLQRDLARLSHSASGSGEDKEQEHPEENPWAATASSGSPNTRAQETPLRVRVGIHTGEVMMQDDGDLFGKHVIVAARIGALASGGQILVSTLVKQITEPRADFVFGPPYEAELKGIDGLSIVHELDWKQFVVEEISP